MQNCSFYEYIRYNLSFLGLHVNVYSIHSKWMTLTQSSCLLTKLYRLHPPEDFVYCLRQRWFVWHPISYNHQCTSLSHLPIYLHCFQHNFSILQIVLKEWMKSSIFYLNLNVGFSLFICMQKCRFQMKYIINFNGFLYATKLTISNYIWCNWPYARHTGFPPGFQFELMYLFWEIVIIIIKSQGKVACWS